MVAKIRLSRDDRIVRSRAPQAPHKTPQRDWLRLAGKWEFMHGLVANPKPNPDCAESGCGLDALYQKAIPLAVRLITEYVDGLSTDAPLDAAYQHTFGEN